MNNRKLAVFYTLCCVALWALIPVVSKLGQSNLDNHQFLFWSSVVSFVSLLAAVFFTKQHRVFLTYGVRDLGKITGLGILGTYLYYILLYYGYANAQGLEVLVLQYCWPMFVVVFSILILREKMTFLRIITLAFGFLGVLIVLTKGKVSQVRLDNLLVDILVLAAAMSFGLFSVLSKKTRFEALTMITIFYFSAVIASFISQTFLSEIKLPTKESIVPILLNGVLVNGFSYVFWMAALKKADASFVAPFVFLTPVLSTIYLVVFFQEKFAPIYLAGLICVIAAGLINSYGERKSAAIKPVTS